MKDGELGRHYSDGEIVFREGDKGEMMYVIQSGEVRITKNGPADEITIATLKSGEIFGEMSLFDKFPRSATAVACGGTRILSVDRKKLFTTISRDPTLMFKIIESMSQRIRNLNDELSRLKDAPPKGKGSWLDVPGTCDIVLQEARKIIKADNGSLMLLEDDGETLSIQAAFGNESPQKTRLKRGIGIAGSVLTSGRAELVGNASLDPRFVDGETQIKALLCVPLKSDDKVFGVINMSNGPSRLFTMDDLMMLVSLSMYASVSIQNAVSFCNLQQATEAILRRTKLML